MSVENFLAQIPLEFREQLETENFIETLIRYLELLKESVNDNEAVLLDSVGEEFFDLASESGFDTSLSINGVTTTVLSGQTANVTNSGTAMLDDTPPKNYRVEIRNGDGSAIRINGNGRLINGQTELTILNQYTVRVVQYFIDDDEFGII